MALRDVKEELQYKRQNLDNIRKWFEPDIETYYKELKSKHMFDWVVYLLSNMQPIGNITADKEAETIKSIELAFNLHPNYWGHGYIVEAISSVMDYLFSFGFQNIILGYDEGNVRSKRVAEKLGFEDFKVKPNNWEKEGVPITTYDMIMSINKWEELTKKDKTL